MVRLVKLSGAFILSMCCLAVPHDVVAQCAGGLCGVGTALLPLSASYEYSLPAFYSAPVYTATATTTTIVPVAPTYVVRERIPVLVRRPIIVAPLVLPFP